MKVIKLTIIVLLGSLWMISCQESEPETTATFDPATLPEADARVELTVTDGDDFFFADIYDLIVNDRGAFAVSQRRENQLLLFDQYGEFQGDLIKQGSGPGEIEQAGRSQFYEDRLLIYDRGSSRINWFEGEEDKTYTYKDSFTHDGVEDPNFSTPQLVFALNDDRIVTSYSPIFQIEEPEEGDPDYGFMRLLDRDGQVLEEELYRYTEREFLVDRRDGGMRVGARPMGNAPEFHVSPDGTVHYNWNEQLKIIRFRIGETDTTEINLELPAHEVTEADRDTALSSYDSESEFYEYASARLPETKPVVKNMLVDESGRYWINLYREEPPHNKWMVLDDKGEPEFRFYSPDYFEAYAVRDHRLYGVQEEGLPVVKVVGVEPS